MRSSVLVVGLVLVPALVAAKPASPIAATAVAFKAGLSKTAYRRLNDRAWVHAGRERSPTRVTLLERKDAAYSESHDTGEDRTASHFVMRDGDGEVFGTIQRTLGGRVMRMTTLERSGTQQKIEVLERNGLFTIGQTFTAAHAPRSVGTQTGSRWLGIGPLRLPLLRPRDEVLHQASEIFAHAEARAFHLDAKLGKLKARVDSRDIALGRDHTAGRATLDTFGTAVGASVYTTWGARGIARTGDNGPRFKQRFFEALDRTWSAGGRIRFDLTGVDTDTRVSPIGQPTYGQITSWELAQIRNTPRFRPIVDFYRQDDHGTFQKLSRTETARILYGKPD